MITEEAREKLKTSLRKKWASGTRRPNPKESIIRGAETRRKKMADGTMRKRHLTPEQAAELRNKRDYENVCAANKRVGLLLAGKSKTTPRLAKGPCHHKARFWVIKNNELNITLWGWNLSDIIRSNSNLFNDSDLNWDDHKGISCRAKKGIDNLFRIKKSTGRPTALSWKWWVAVDLADSEI